MGRERTAEEEEKKQNCHVREGIGEVRCDAENEKKERGSAKESESGGGDVASPHASPATELFSVVRERGRGKEGRKEDGDGEREVKRSLARNGNLSRKRERGRDLLLMCSYAHRRARVG